MNIEKIMDFFYLRTSLRVKEKVVASNLRHQDIYPNDSKQISRIINNNRTRNNRFLIPDAVIQSYEDKESYGLLKKLDFKSEKELLWGTDEEIEAYLFELFEILWSEVSSEKNPYNIDAKLYLSDYIPYAKYQTYWDIIFSKENKYPALFYAISEDDVICNIDRVTSEAILYLYQKCKHEFQDIFNTFTKDNKSYHKIDRIFKEKFIEKKFIPLLEKHEPNASSLGLRVSELINSDLIYCAPLVACECNNQFYLSKLISASETYIRALEDIQGHIINI